jgi:hypothetical protein
MKENKVALNNHSFKRTNTMIISDLNHVEIVSDSNNIEGGRGFSFSSVAYASSGALAIGSQAYTSASNDALAAPGFSQSQSNAFASSYTYISNH